MQPRKAFRDSVMELGFTEEQWLQMRTELSYYGLIKVYDSARINDTHYEKTLETIFDYAEEHRERILRGSSPDGHA
mgnify:CR=1 FL=1